jgi:hypothetical protein
MSEKQPITLPWDELAPLILAHKGVTSGFWRIGVRLQLAAINLVHPKSHAAQPAGVVAIENVGMYPVDAPGALVYDAATGKLAVDVPPHPGAAKKAAAKPVGKAAAQRRGRPRP